MDPSGAGICGQGQRTIDQSYAKGLPFTAAFRDTSQQSIRMPVAEDTDGDTGADSGLQPSEVEFRGHKTEESVGKTKEQRGWRKVIRNFTPS